MPAHDPPPTLPKRGVEGGWRDAWSDDDTAEVRERVQAAARTLEAAARREGKKWKREITVEKRRKMMAAAAAGRCWDHEPHRD